MELEPGAEFESDGRTYRIIEVDFTPAEGEYAATFTVYAEEK